MKRLKTCKNFIRALVLILACVILSEAHLNAAPPPPQWTGGWGSDLDVYASVFVDAWWTPGTYWTSGEHHIYLYNDEGRSMNYTWKMHHELVGYAHLGGIWRAGTFDSVDGKDYERRTGYPDIVLTASNIRDFPGAGDYMVHSRTGVEVTHPLASHRSDSWEVQSDYAFRYIPPN